MPTIPTLVGSAEAAAILEISPTNFAHLRRNLTEAGDTDFPEPIQTLACGPIWRQSDVAKFKPKFEQTRRRRRSSAEVAAERAEKAAAKEARTQPEEKAAPAAKTVKAKAAPKVTKSEGAANTNPAAKTTKVGPTKRVGTNKAEVKPIAPEAAADETVQSNAKKVGKAPIESTPPGAVKAKTIGRKTAPTKAKAKLSLVKS